MISRRNVLTTLIFAPLAVLLGRKSHAKPTKKRIFIENQQVGFGPFKYKVGQTVYYWNGERIFQGTIISRDIDSPCYFVNLIMNRGKIPRFRTYICEEKLFATKEELSQAVWKHSVDLSYLFESTGPNIRYIDV
jgi:hypothetical protein